MPDALASGFRRTRRLRLNLFSPLPPARTDIAHYVVRSLPALADHLDVVVWTDGEYWPPEIEASARVCRWDGASWRALNAADATLYHIGNNARFHGWIWDVARRHPGVIVLHDIRLHAFFSALLRGEPDGDARYLSAIRRCHGDAGAARAARLLSGDAAPATLDEELPLTDLVLERACGLVVHSDEAFQHAAARARCSIAQLDLPFQAGPPVVPRAWDGVLRLVVFGYLGANRRLGSLLDAIASFPDREQLRLTILGELEHPEPVAERIHAHRLGDIVRVRGFVTDQELDAELDRAHLAVNLRYPTMGEASGSQLRIWSRGLASVVTRAGWYGQLPPEAVWFVDPANEVADLHRHFRAAMQEPDALARMGEAGRRQLEAQHDPARYAAGLAMAIDRMIRMPVTILPLVMDAVSRVLTDARMTGTAKASVARRAARELSRWTATPAGSRL